MKKLFGFDNLLDEKINSFKNREVKAKEIFQIQEIEKSLAYNFIKKYHYLKDVKFLSIYCFGLYLDDVLVGVSTYSTPQGTSTLKGWFGLENTDLSVMELSRLCIIPSLNGTNATSYLLGNSLKLLKNKNIRAVITLADDSRHVGSIYQVCNFTYYGLTDKKSDFYSVDGKKNVRGTSNDKMGVWIPRTQKHRYCYIIDKNLKCLYKEQPKPKIDMIKSYDCCNGTKKVLDKRYNILYTCPICTGKVEKVIE